MNLIFVSRLLSSSYIVSFNSKVVIKWDGCVIATGDFMNGLFLIFPVANDKFKPIESTYLWHFWLSHISPDRIKSLSNYEPFDLVNMEAYLPCISCLVRKMTNIQFPKKAKRAEYKLELVHSDVCGPINIATRGYIYYLMTHKFEFFEKYTQFRIEVEK